MHARTCAMDYSLDVRPRPGDIKSIVIEFDILRNNNFISYILNLVILLNTNIYNLQWK